MMSTGYFPAIVFPPDKIKDAQLSCYFLLHVEAIFLKPQLAVIPAWTQEAAPPHHQAAPPSFAPAPPLFTSQWQTKRV